MKPRTFLQIFSKIERQRSFKFFQTLSKIKQKGTPFRNKIERNPEILSNSFKDKIEGGPENISKIK